MSPSRAGVALRDPTAEASPTKRERRTPPPSLAGVAVALLDIGKMRSDEFIDRLQARFAERGIATRRYRKPTNTRVAPTEVLQSIAADCAAAVIALSD